jgi:uncharacterized membrane protein YedE/YeeE
MMSQAIIALLSITLLPAIGLAADPGTDPAAYSGPAWSPYLVGALIGVLSMFTFYFSNKPLGASTAYARVAGILGALVAPRHTKSLKYYEENKPVIDWEVMLVVGVIFGAFLSAWQGNELTGEWLPRMWEARFGEDTIGLRWLAALSGGVLMAFGARLAGGCTSGHGISGTMQLSVGSWIAVICFFASGIATAMLMFRL